MKLLFDQNLSPKLASVFRDEFEYCQHLQDINLGESDDRKVWEYANTNNFTIVTKDSDFNNLVSYFGFPPKVIWLRKGNCSTKAIINSMNLNMETIKSFIEDNKNGILSIL